MAAAAAYYGVMNMRTLDDRIDVGNLILTQDAEHGYLALLYFILFYFIFAGSQR